MGVLRARIALLKAREAEEARLAAREAARESAARRAQAAAREARPPLPRADAGAPQTWDEVQADSELLASWHERAWSAVRDAHAGMAPPLPPAPPSSPSSGALPSEGEYHGAVGSFDYGDEAFY